MAPRTVALAGRVRAAADRDRTGPAEALDAELAVAVTRQRAAPPARLEDRLRDGDRGRDPGAQLPGPGERYGHREVRARIGRRADRAHRCGAARAVRVRGAPAG